MGSNQLNTQPSAGVTQSQLGPTLTPGLVRMLSATPSVSATHAPAARSTTHPRGSHGDVEATGRVGLVVHAPATHRHAPGGGPDSSQATRGFASTHRFGKQPSSQPQSASAVHATVER